MELSADFGHGIWKTFRGNECEQVVEGEREEAASDVGTNTLQKIVDCGV